MKTQSIWSFQRNLTTRLYLWSALSIFAGIMMLFFSPFWRGMGIMFIGWGAIDAAIAFFGSRSARKKEASLPSAASEAVEARNIRRILLINTVLDVLYIAAGIWIILTQPDPFWQGSGWGVIVQGGFLFLFDFYHTLLCPKS